MLEPELAQRYATILMAQVGSPSFYREANPYVFGMHIDSDFYPVPLVQTLSLHSNRQPGGPSKQPVTVLYSNESEFYSSTCRSAITALNDAGFKNVTEIRFDPFQDHDANGILNSEDANFLNGLADQACPKKSEEAEAYPVIFVCTRKEQDMILKRWKDIACRPLSLWMTSAGLSWATDNLDAVPYMQGGAQWHETFDYSDSYFESGPEFLAHCKEEFGYDGSYDQVVSYSIAVLFSLHISTLYRITDVPNVTEDLAADEGYEIWRRSLLVLKGDTLFGPFALDSFHRNIGRGSAGTQWLPDTLENTTSSFRNKCVSPLPQADAAIELQSKAATTCDAGFYVSVDAIRLEASILSSKCRLCPKNTFEPAANNDVNCMRCPDGSSTEGLEGSTDCVIRNPNLLPSTVKSLGICLVGIVWFMAIFFALWLIKHRHYEVAQRGHPQFLGLICVGAIISSSTIIALMSAEAESVENFPSASRACVAIPFLYTTGWIFQYASLSVKAYRMYCDIKGSRYVSTLLMWLLVFLAWALDLLVVIVWTTQNPLEYAQHHVASTVVSNTITIETIGQCQSSGGVSVWAYVAPLLLLHSALMIVTNTLLWKIGVQNDRYHEERYIAIASVCVFEVLVIGIPMVFAVIEDNMLTFIAQSLVVFLNDTCILVAMFGPKIRAVSNDVGGGRDRMPDEVMMQISKESAVNSCVNQATSAKVDGSSALATTAQVPATHFEECKHEE